VWDFFASEPSARWLLKIEVFLIIHAAGDTFRIPRADFWQTVITR
jgi:hypothetical protein